MMINPKACFSEHSQWPPKRFCLCRVWELMLSFPSLDVWEYGCTVVQNNVERIWFFFWIYHSVRILEATIFSKLSSSFRLNHNCGILKWRMIYMTYFCICNYVTLDLMLKQNYYKDSIKACFSWFWWMCLNYVQINCIINSLSLNAFGMFLSSTFTSSIRFTLSALFFVVCWSL